MKDSELRDLLAALAGMDASLDSWRALLAPAHNRKFRDDEVERDLAIGRDLTVARARAALASAGGKP